MVDVWQMLVNQENKIILRYLPDDSLMGMNDGNIGKPSNSGKKLSFYTFVPANTPELPNPDLNRPLVIPSPVDQVEGARRVHFGVDEVVNRRDQKIVKLAKYH